MFKVIRLFDATILASSSNWHRTCKIKFLGRTLEDIMNLNITHVACCLIALYLFSHASVFAENAGENEVIMMQKKIEALNQKLSMLETKLDRFELEHPKATNQSSGQVTVPAYIVPPGQPQESSFVHAMKDINLGGYADVQWNQNFNDGFKQNQNNTLRLYDNRKDSFTVNQALLYLEKPVTDAGQVGFKIATMFGEDARTSGADGLTGDAFDLLLAYAEYKAPLNFWDDNEYLPHWVDIQAGRMLTLAGVEVPLSPLNNEISRGFLYSYAVPTAHTGIRTNFKVWKDFFDVYFGINNGWDQAVDINSEKTLEWGLGYEPIKNLKFMHAVYLGQEGAGLASNRFLSSNVMTWNPIEKLFLAGEIDYGTSRGVIKFDEDPYDNGNWFGLGAHVKYQLSKKFAPYLRSEWMLDESKTRLLDNSTDPTRTGNGYTPNVWGNTFGAEYKLTDALIARTEYRLDKSVTGSTYDGSFSQEQTLETQLIYLI